jgi:lipid-A-disaccharide synthase
MGAKTLFLLCGEPSGEVYAARVARAFRERYPGVPLEGIGSSRLESQGVRLLRDYGDISVMGFTGVVKRLPEIRSALRAAKDRVSRPDIGAVVLVDFPDFNFRVGLAAWKRGVPVVYYIPPQVWAWRTGRARTLARFTRGAVVLFPFEEKFLRRYGVNAVFAGHPLLEELAPVLDAPAEPASFGFPPGKRVVGLLPGSRAAEVEMNLPLLLSSGRIVAERFPDVHFALPVARPSLRGSIERHVSGCGLPLTVVSEDRHRLFRCMGAAIAVSGTVTLELALLGVPSVIVYRTNWLNYHIVKRLAKVSSAGLPNLVSGEPFLPELLQYEFTPARAADALCGMMEDEARLEALRRRCVALRDILRGPGPTEAVVDMLGREAASAWA